MASGNLKTNFVDDSMKDFECTICFERPKSSMEALQHFLFCPEPSCSGRICKTCLEGLDVSDVTCHFHRERKKSDLKWEHQKAFGLLYSAVSNLCYNVEALRKHTMDALEERERFEKSTDLRIEKLEKKMESESLGEDVMKNIRGQLEEVTNAASNNDKFKRSIEVLQNKLSLLQEDMNQLKKSGIESMQNQTSQLSEGLEELKKDSAQKRATQPYSSSSQPSLPTTSVSHAELDSNDRAERDQSGNKRKRSASPSGSRPRRRLEVGTTVFLDTDEQEAEPGRVVATGFVNVHWLASDIYQYIPEAHLRDTRAGRQEEASTYLQDPAEAPVWGPGSGSVHGVPPAHSPPAHMLATASGHHAMPPVDHMPPAMHSSSLSSSADNPAPPAQGGALRPRTHPLSLGDVVARRDGKQPGTGLVTFVDGSGRDQRVNVKWGPNGMENRNIHNNRLYIVCKSQVCL